MIPESIKMSDYQYSLPDERIAKFPLERRDESKLLIYRQGLIQEYHFKELPEQLPQNALMVFNNTRVIRARLVFRKETGAKIELFCLEPLLPADYERVFTATGSCEWMCLVGNSKKWKEGALKRTLEVKGNEVSLEALTMEDLQGHRRIRFQWNDESITFADLLESAGVLPIPPYLNRETVERDLQTYQTVYSKIKGSVAAPTAGLHFTPEVLDSLEQKGIKKSEVTLHVGAGTFKPVKSETIGGHEMHSEYISVNIQVFKDLVAHQGPIIAVGTTSVRTLESLFWLGVQIVQDSSLDPEHLVVEQWEPYHATLQLTAKESFQAIIDFLEKHDLDCLQAHTRIIIVPGYSFKVVDGLVTNFHQPGSTLLLLVSAFVGGDWRTIYDYALAHDFRFLSYGDSSFLLRNSF